MPSHLSICDVNFAAPSVRNGSGSDDDKLTYMHVRVGDMRHDAGSASHPSIHPSIHPSARLGPNEAGGRQKAAELDWPLLRCVASVPLFTPTHARGANASLQAHLYCTIAYWTVLCSGWLC